MVLKTLARFGLKSSAIKSLIVGIVFIIFGIILAIYFKSFKALFLSLVGLLGLGVAWINLRIAQRV